ncbi:MAG: choice-of-anchor P family protein [Thermoplasmatota archaeon]
MQILQGPGAPYTLSGVHAAQTGPGMAHDYDDAGEVHVFTSEGDLVRVTVAPARTDVKVTGDPLEAGSWTTAKVLDVDILDGLITADVVNAATYATADIRSAKTDSGSSDIVGLKIKGVDVTRVEPGLDLPLPDLLGAGGFVRVYERTEDSHFPDGPGDMWTGDVTVRMIHVLIADYDLLTLGAQPLEVVIGMSHSHASVPTPFCGIMQYANAGAYIARIRPDAVFNGRSILVGEQHTGPVNGNAHQELLGEAIPTDGAVLKVDVTETSAVTKMTPGVDSRGDAFAKVTGACLLMNATGDCVVSATLLKSESHSVANGQRAMSYGHTTIVGLKVAGVDVCATLGLQDTCSPAYNTKLEIGGIKVVLNEREHTSAQPGHTDLAVRAVHVTVPGVGDVFLARSYSEASYLDLH